MDLKDYLEHVYKLEASCYEQQKLINNLHSQLRYAKNQKLEAKKALPKRHSLWNTLLLSLGIYFIVAIPCEFIMGEKTGYVLASTIWLISLIVCFFAFDVPVMKSNKAEREKVIKENERIEKGNQTLQKRLPVLVTRINSQIAQATASYNNTQSLLQQIYSANIIYPKYRGLIPVSMFYEYICSGRCRQLEGHEGAYNIYEQEIRLNIIINKLDIVISRLDEIEQNQYMLANAIRESNRRAEQMYSALQSIDSNTRVAAYYSGISAMNTTYMAWFKKYNR